MIDLSGDARAQPFRFDGDAPGTAADRLSRGDPPPRPFPGCLLVHGFTGTPFEMRPIGEALARRGWTVVAPLLPGHGTRVEDLAPTRWEDWYRAVLDAWDDLGRSTTSRAAAGLSMGALLVLHLAHERRSEVGAAALLAPAIRLRNQRSADQSLWLSRIPRLPRRVAILRKEEITPTEISVARRPAYDEVPVRALASMIRLQRTVRRELPAIHVPALVLEGGSDLTVSRDAAAIVENGLGSAEKRRVVFPASGHILTEDVEAAQVIAAVEDFLAAHLETAAAPLDAARG